MKQIIALGGGGFLMEPDNPRLDDYVLGAARRKRPRVCFLPTASGDNPDAIERFYRAFPASRGVEASHLSLFRMETRRTVLASQLLAQDVIYVGGGNTANMLAVWRVHGVDRLLRRAWNRGIVLAGVSAGMICWFENGVTDSFGRPLRGLWDGLGFLPGVACPHYDGEKDRRRVFHTLVRAISAGGHRGKAGRGGAGPADMRRTTRRRPAWAADDGCALHFVGRDFHAAVASRERADGYQLVVNGRQIVETNLHARRLG